MFEKEGTPNATPVLQCVQIKPLVGQQGTTERYRVVFSDIRNFVQSMLATRTLQHVPPTGASAADLLRRGESCSFRGEAPERLLCQTEAVSSKFIQGQAVRVHNLIKQNCMTDRTSILIVLDLEVLEELGTCEKIGAPLTLEVGAEEDTKQNPTTISAGGFYGKKEEQKYQPQQQSLPSRSNGPSSSAHGNIYPIEALSPYAHKWTVKARCTNKSEIKTWHNKNGEGKLFSVNLLDESGEIKATGFNDQCDTLYETFQEGSVYYISSPCRVQLAKKQFTNLNNDYELTFERDSMIEKVSFITQPIATGG